MNTILLFCPACGKEPQDKNDQFCGNCGRHLSQQPAMSIPIPVWPKPSSTPNRRNILKLGSIGIASITAITAIGTGIFTIRQQSSPQDHLMTTPTNPTVTPPRSEEH